MSPTMPAASRSRNGFVDPAAPSLATLIERLPSLEPDARKRGEMASAIRSFCRVAGLAPTELPADMALLGRLARKALPAAAGMSPARWANSKSLVLAALARSGLSLMPGRRLHPLSPPWQALNDRLPGSYERAQLSRLMRWCSAQGIEPPDLTQTLVEIFGDALLHDSFIKDPWQTWQRSAVAWNRAAATIAGWPALTLEAPSRRKTYALPLSAFPPAFQADAQRWLDRLAGKAGLEEGPLRPVREATLKKWRFAIRQMASALVESGRDPASLTSLAELVTLEAAEAMLTFFHRRSGGVACAQTGSIAGDLKAIARHHAGTPEAVLVKLRRMAGKVTPKPQGMTGKNRAMLRQFAGEAQQRQLLTLPQRLYARLPAKQPLPVRLAQRLQSAMAVAMLLAAPMRLRNLCRLEPGRHLQAIGRGRNERWFVVIPGDEVKNGEPIELPLPERTTALLELYRKRVLPVLAPSGSQFLFPGLKGAKAEVSLDQQIPRFLGRELGIRLSVHQFRHLVGFIYLQHHPDGHEVIRRMLGHRDIGTTIKFYAGMETIAAARHYEAVIDELLTVPAAARGRGRNSRHRGGMGSSREVRP